MKHQCPYLNKCSYVNHEGLCSCYNKLVYTSNSMGSVKKKNRKSAQRITSITFWYMYSSLGFPFSMQNSWMLVKFRNISTDLIFGLACLKNCRNFGISMMRGLLRASLSSCSAESSQIFCSAPNAPYKCKSANTH